MCTVIIVTALVTEDERGGQGHTSAAAIYIHPSAMVKIAFLVLPCINVCFLPRQTSTSFNLLHIFIIHI
jgi:hypothetical protein